jgi:hypothetical protein
MLSLPNRDSPLVNPAPIVVFLHHQKASGTTLRTLLRCQYAPPGVVDLPGELFDPAELAAVAEQIDPERTLLVMGHLTYGLHRLVARPVVYITMLRDPVDRVLSLYHARLRKQEAGRADAVARFGDVMAWLDSGAIEADNAQTRFLAGAHPPIGGVTPALVAEATRHLERDMAVFGLSERFDESIVLLQQRLGWRDSCYVPQNITPDRPDYQTVPDEVRRAIAERNACDVELYAFAARLFEERMREAGPGFAGALRAHAARNERFAAHLANGSRQPPPAPSDEDRLLQALAGIWRREEEIGRLRRDARAQADVIRKDQERLTLQQERHRSDVETAMAELHDASREIKRLQKRRVKDKSEIKQGEALLAEAARTGACPPSAHIAMLERRIAKLQRLVTLARTRRRSLRTRVHDLEVQFANAQRHAEKLHHDLEASGHERRALRQQLRALQERIARQTGQVERLRGDLAAARHERERVQSSTAYRVGTRIVNNRVARALRRGRPAK